jgi:uncharacterized protein YndB with AHSA1/START domain
MRWFLGLALVIALITGVLYGVGRFLLPNDLDVSRTASIERPRASVFALVNDLRIAKEWSPYYALDPEAEFTFSGEPGPGQSMRWDSDVRQVGSGRMSIVNATANEEVESLLDLGERATLSSRISMQRAARVTVVDWTVSARCAPGNINVPCRYMNLVMRGMIEKDLASGLARLKTLAEQLPDVDFEDLKPEYINAAPQSYIFSQVTTSNQDAAQIDQAIAIAMSQLAVSMERASLTPAGPQLRVTTEWSVNDNRISFRIGYPFDGASPLTLVGVQIGQTPSGPAVRAMHEGPRGQTQITYAKIYAFLQAHRVAVREDGLPWEVIHKSGGADGEGSRIEIFVPLQ